MLVLEVVGGFVWSGSASSDFIVAAASSLLRLSVSPMYNNFCKSKSKKQDTDSWDSWKDRKYGSEGDMLTPLNSTEVNSTQVYSIHFTEVNCTQLTFR